MQNAIRTHQIDGLLDRAPAGIRILSLDCFDTLLWRDVNAPADVFADLPLPGGAIEARQRAEIHARRTERQANGTTEIGISAIHSMFRSGAMADAVQASVDQELEAEARHCYGFAPIIALMRQAKARGLSVIIVSDTYLNEQQLRTLITRAAGADVIALIDRIFCSSAYGRGKGHGLFEDVLADLTVPPSTILHLGDNKRADFEAPNALGIHGWHMVQFDEECATRLRLEASMAALSHAPVRSTTPAYQPHRPLVSMRHDDAPAHALGHDVLGPMMAGFALWLHAEQAEIAARSTGKTHLLFLLRDGHLPAQVYRELYGVDQAATVEISRLTAIKAGMVDEASLTRHLAMRAHLVDAATVAQQLNISVRDVAPGLPEDVPGDTPAFLAAMRKPASIARVIKQSAKFAERLCAHLKRAGVAPGDSVIFADLGYNGSVQSMIEPMLRATLDVEVYGRYLLLREDFPSGHEKRGYFDAQSFDFRTLDSLCDPIAVVEQLVTVAQGSVIDYHPNGAPVRGRDVSKGRQSAIRDQVQAGAIAYAARLRDWPGRWSVASDMDAWRIANLGILARLLFMPSHEEIALLDAFEHDFNFGSDDKLMLMDQAKSSADLRRAGMLSINQAKRMFVPGELRQHGLQMNLALYAARRHRLELQAQDFHGASLAVPLIMADHRGEVAITGQAMPTHDGYYALTIPVGQAQYNAAILWGQMFEWVEIREMLFEDVMALTKAEELSAEAMPAQTMYDGMDCTAGHLFHCTEENALSLTPPPDAGADGPLALKVIFRPIVRRANVTALRKAA